MEWVIKIMRAHCKSNHARFICVHFNDANRVFTCSELNNACSLDDFIATANHKKFLDGFASIIAGSLN
jgi:hypothetical protein